MFATSSRNRASRPQGRGQGEMSPPPPGTDSFYGVRSLNGSVWSDVDALAGSTEEVMSPFVGEREDDERDEVIDENEDDGEVEDRSTWQYGTTPTANNPLSRFQDMTQGSQPTPQAQNARLEESPVLKTRMEFIPPSPDDTLHPLHPVDEPHSPSFPPDLVSPTPADFYQRRLQLAQLDSESSLGSQSVPSSPASFTSLPSYVASLSSASRTSSPVSGYGQRHFSPGRDGAREVSGGSGGGDDLVLPRLHLPSSSLHASLPRLHNVTQATSCDLKIALVGSKEQYQGVITGLLEMGIHLVDLGAAAVGIVKEGVLAASVRLYTNVETASTAVSNHYRKLLPVWIPNEMESLMKDVVHSFSKSSEWVHLVVMLDGTLGVESISPLAPTIAKHAQVDTLFALPIVEESRAPTPSPPHAGGDPTPMPSSSTSKEYFSSKTVSTLSDAQDDVAGLVMRAIDNTTLVQSHSRESFFQWRRALIDSSSDHIGISITPTESTTTSHSAHSSTSFENPRSPMPTVARAAGGGEWEANLSRRMATAHAHAARKAHHRGRNRRVSRDKHSDDRTTDEYKTRHRDAEAKKHLERERRHGPLFPPTRVPAYGASDVLKIVRVGFHDIWRSITGSSTPPPDDGGKRPSGPMGWNWRRSFLAATTTIALVGLGYWATVRS